jgi:hypothetical protein
MADDGGVLGNLPRSRPGQRSEKRTEATAARAASRAERSGSKAAAPGSQTGGARPKAAGSKPRARKAASSRRTAGAGPTEEERPVSGGGDPVGDAVRTVTGVAATGARVATGVAREVLRRLPRP